MAENIMSVLEKLKKDTKQRVFERVNLLQEKIAMKKVSQTKVVSTLASYSGLLQVGDAHKVIL